MEKRSPTPNLDSSDDEDVGNEETKRLEEALTPDSDDSALSDEDVGGGGYLRGDHDDTLEDEAADEQQPKVILPRAVSSFLERLPPRWRNLFQRGVSGLILISGFYLIICLGPAGLLFLTYLVMTACYTEVMNLGYKVTGAKHLGPLAWAFFIVQQYSFVGDKLVLYSGISEEINSQYHLAITCALYIGCLIWFVTSLEKDYIKSYAILAWSHMTLFFFGFPGHLLNVTVMEGMIWYVLPMTLITLNDIAAYYVGFFFGKTPLIKLSPKKTVEGFVGGGLLTVIFGTYISYLLMTPYLICPVKSQNSRSFEFRLFNVDTACEPNSVFTLKEVQISGFQISVYPFLVHAFVISAICSVIGPFGGFLASGFKRACKRKNFGSLIPGHGGVTDRCDCMFLCAAIIHFYYNAFVKEDQINASGYCAAPSRS